MTAVEAILDTVALVAFAVALVAALRLPVRRIGWAPKVLLVLAAAIYIFAALATLLDTLAGIVMLDVYEDHAQILFLPFAVFFLYAFRSRQELHRRVRAEQDLRAVIRSSPLAIIALAPDGRVRMWNPAAEAIFGWTEQEVLGRANPIVPPDQREEHQAWRDRVMRSHRPSQREVRRCRKDGTEIDVSVSAAPTYDARGQVVGVMAVATDITERKRTEEALRRSEERYRSFIQQSTEGIYRAEGAEPLPVDLPEDEQIRHFYDSWYVAECNAAFARMYGYDDPEELCGRPIEVFHGGRDRPENIEMLRQVVRGGYRVSGLESCEVDREGRTKWFLNNITGIVEDDRLVRVWGTQRDITDRKQAEQALRRSETRFRQLVETMHDGLWVQDEQGRITYVNERLCDILGRPREELLGRPIAALLDGPNRQALEAEMRRPDGAAGPVEVQWHTPAGRRATTLVSTRRLDGGDAAEERVFGVLTDVTEQKRLEEALTQAQKMEAIGRLAGGIAHDFNNQLTVIHGYCDLLLRGERVDEQHRSLIQEIQRAASRSARLTSQLLAFSRKQVLRPQQVDVGTVVKEMRDPLARMVGEDIRLTVRLGENVGPTRVDRYQLEQALMNMAVNARDAMPNGGELTIETANATIGPEGLPEDPEAAPGPYVRLTVRDTGVGMDAQTRRRIFEPFFTTKEIGKGTGLGLSMVYGFVKQSGGHIRVETAPGEGSAFHIYLPRVEPDTEQVEEAGAGVAGRAPAGRTLLVVEDEESLRRLIVRALKRQGYEVLEAADGRQALPIGTEHAAEIDLLITDVVMPEMGGVELARRLRRQRPDLPVLLLSGYTQARVGPEAEAIDGNVLPKPFTPTQLLERIAELLGGGQERS